ncbi:MGH1-like glycoside hydrolase domain-containing protein [Sphingomonas immobilis]|uniref:Glycogen debranching protein n=1 Tax=Sphingomonas immobilis TaxID=3063997 RepID=A0ABT8ZTD6_9SPHN|nr:glycogen debranching protein [Sphingomonas sp. CA1-15]MDO7840823.1 glycogen debranching protein [Sphingomonas sp. CA1-15]
MAAAAPAPPTRLDAPKILAERYGSDAAWYVDNIPLFESSDPLLDRVYYYRWQVFRAHQRDLGAKGYITTEFLDDVGWQREPYASLNDATGFHLYEGRWLRDRRFADDYINFLYDEGGNDRHFSEAIADAVWARYLVDHDRAGALRHLGAMRHVYGLWDDHFDVAKGLYWIEPLLDATEYTVSSIDASGGKDGFRGGDAFRPSINSYMAANARAIARIAALAGEDAVAADYAGRAERLKARMLADLWSAPLGHFVDRYKVGNEHVRSWEPIRARELVGYLPWTFGLVDDPRYTAAWKHLLSPRGFAGAAGMRTVEPSYQYYMRQYRYDKDSGGRECQWNGPVWPFQTTQVLMGMANLLHDAPQGAVTRADYMRLLRQYARLHLQGDRLDLEEDYDPETGKPIVGLARSHHYFHSGFDDLVITGLVGLRPSDGDDLTVDPLIATEGKDRIRHFALQDVPYHGRLVSVFYDEDGSRYGAGRGLRLYVDGVLAGQRETPGRLTVTVQPRTNRAIERPVDLAVNLVRSDFPRADASSGRDPEKLHDAIDGRLWSFPESPNGWDSTAKGATEWFSLDLGKSVSLRSAELSFFAGGTFAPPSAYRLQYWAKEGWIDLSSTSLRHTVTTSASAWQPVSAQRLRVVFTKRPGTQIRLSEVKLF